LEKNEAGKIRQTNYQRAKTEKEKEIKPIKWKRKRLLIIGSLLQ
jgi:hypothetical protein